MFNFMRLDFKVIHKNTFCLIFLILFILMLIPMTIASCFSNEMELESLLLYIINIFIYILVIAPTSKNKFQENSNNYSMLVFSLPVKRKDIVNGKYLYLLLANIACNLILLLVYLITNLISKQSMHLEQLLAIISPTHGGFLISGSIYMFLFFSFRNYVPISSIFYALSLFSYLVMNSKIVNFTRDDNYLLLITSVFVFILSYVLSLFFVKRRAILK